jgi:CBS domain-containing protein
MQTKNGADEALYGFVGCTVRQFMTRTVITVNRRTTMRELAALYEKHDFNAFPVVEDGILFGIINKFDFLRAFTFTTSQVVPHYNELMSRPAFGRRRLRAPSVTRRPIQIATTSTMAATIGASKRPETLSID